MPRFQLALATIWCQFYATLSGTVWSGKHPTLFLSRGLTSKLKWSHVVGHGPVRLGTPHCTLNYLSYKVLALVLKILVLFFS